MKTKLHEFEFIWQADGLSQLLKDAGIDNAVVTKPREYASIITGAAQGTFEILVDETQWADAQAMKNSFLDVSNSEPGLQAPSKEFEVLNGAKQPRRLFSKIMFFSFASILILPIIFNVAAWLNYRELKKTSASERQIQIAGLVQLIGAVGAAALLFLVWWEF